MKRLFHSHDRQLLLSMIVLSLASLIALVILNLVFITYTNKGLKNTFAGIVGTVVELYPQAEAQIIQDLRSPDADATNLGSQVLENYGMDDGYTANSDFAGKLQVRFLVIGLGVIALVCGGFIFLLLRYQRAVSTQVSELSTYLQHIDAGDYSLDVRDNGEGSFSLLKNDLYKVTVRLREQSELLQKDKTALSNLIADISHQIKTPLTSVGVMADVLAEDPPEAERHAFIERLRTQLGRIQWLVTALLKLARLDAGTAAFKQEPVNIHRLIDKALEPLQIPLEIKKQQVLIEGDQEASYSGDFNWSTEALTNVIKNCVEHTPEGGKIEIRYEENALYAEMIISDNGEGIASRDLPNIFNRFYRGGNADENSVGIGLALAKAIFNAQGGDITIRSQIEIGTSFEIRIFRGVV